MKFSRNQVTHMFADGLLAMLAWFLATYLRFDCQIPAEIMATLPILMALAAGLAIIAGMVCRTYIGLWAYMGFSEMFRQLAATGLMGTVFLIIKAFGRIFISGSITVIACGIYMLLSLMLRGLPRLRRWLLVRKEQTQGNIRPVVVVGAGNASALVIHRLKEEPLEGLYPVAVVDDSPHKIGRQLIGVPVAGRIDEVAEVCKKFRAEQIVISIPTATEEQMDRIYSCCAEAKVPIRIVSNISDVRKFTEGEHRALKEVSIEDLLFRDSVQPDMAPVYAFLKGKRVMVTGGAGSIGSEICRQVLAHGCEHLVIFDIHENGLFALNEELKAEVDPSRYSLCIGSVRDLERLQDVMKSHQPDIVLHAAAHKHVPLMEINPGEAIKNNIFGTRNVITSAAENGVKRFILISTDKAVNPTNIMGATKRVAELLVQSMNGMGGCEMAAVRFGNVLGSNGSVIPIFQKQIAAGGPVTVTDKEIKRFFMTIPEAVSLVLSAGTLAKGGEIFVLDMGKPIRIYDLACSLIKLSGLHPERDIPIKIVGLRSGEKMFEEIALDEESVDCTSYKKIFVLRQTASKPSLCWETFEQEMEDAISTQGAKRAVQLTFSMIGEMPLPPP